MNVSQIRKSCQVIDPIRVTVEEVNDATEAEVIAFALSAAGETPHTYFGAHCTIWPDGLATVTIWRD